MKAAARLFAAGAAAVLALALALIALPFGAPIAPIRASDPAVVSPSLRAAFATEPHLDWQITRALMGPKVARDRPFAALVVMLRLRVLTSSDQRAGWLAAHAGYLPTPGLPALARLTQSCFATRSADLSPAQSATLMAMARLGPVGARQHPDRPLARRDAVLRAMAASGTLPSDALAPALETPLAVCG